MDCLFCKIIKGEIPSYTFYEDEIVKVFLDVNPEHNGHSLIIPKKHYLDIYELDDETLTHINKIGKQIGKLLTEKLNAEGITFIQNNGIDQMIKHYHLHVIPKYKEEINKDVKDIYNILK